MSKRKHYIPILRWKAAERKALHQLSHEHKKFITPLIELMMPRPDLYKGDTKEEKAEKKEKSVEELWRESISLFKKALTKVSEDILKYWGRDPIFIDVHFVDPSIRAKSLEALLEAGKQLDIFMIPVVNLIAVIDLESDKKTLEIAVRHAKENDYGLGLRLLRSNLRRNSLPTEIQNFLTMNGLTEKQVDLIVDLDLVDPEYSSLVDSLKRIPNLTNWRTFTVVSGAFPPDLTNLPVGRHEIERSDWKNWDDKKHFEKLTRKPSYGDYTIQHPKYKEPPRVSYPSASIRYTADGYWVVMRGQGGPKRKSNQYLANAQLLKNQPEYSGEKFCFGDAYIAQMAVDLSSTKTGSPTTWLTAGINHHLAKVADQLSNLPD